MMIKYKKVDLLKRSLKIISMMTKLKVMKKVIVMSIDMIMRCS